ncbi:MAG TPA: serine/threonine-protein kinase, partial [Methanolinea sp.]|nr:serine/threonine-protein kinase [Methanolinea sp.]HQI15131.1 serine/threonine-protein kinase [Methanolinea sp.]
PTPTPSPTPTTTATTSPTPTETTTPIESTIPAGLPATSPVPSNTTVPFETGPGNQGGLLPPSSPLRTLLVLVTGLLATVILSRDVLSSSREPLIPLKKRIIALFVLGIPCVAQAMALHATIRSGGAGGALFFDLAVVVIPVSLYLVLSGTGLVIGALLSWPFRGMLKAHTVAGVVMVFLSLFSLARGDDPAPAITGLFLLSGLLAALGARWQEGLYPAGKGHGTRGEAENRVAGNSSDVTRALPSRGQGMLPPDLADKYSSIEFIGSGGLAHVYRAVNSATGQEVALKIPLRSDETTGKSFMKEIRGWEGLYHPNIVRVNEANILPIPYIEMEYIRRTLADVPKPLPVREAARIARDLCRGLSHAHERQVIHRDIKPHNIMITDDGIPKISDWGMSKIMGIPGMPTITGFSLAYAAPEQLAPGTFGETDRRTDIYQLGCVLYELLTGRVPFPGTDMAQVTAAILSATPPLPSELNPAARPLDTIVMRCLAKKPEDRYQDARDLERDLDQFLSGTSPYDDFDIFEDT